MSCIAESPSNEPGPQVPNWQFHAAVIARGIPILRLALGEHIAGAPGFAASEAAAVIDDLEEAITALLAITRETLPCRANP